jgi:hypothetical protein
MVTSSTIYPPVQKELTPFEKIAIVHRFEISAYSYIIVNHSMINNRAAIIGSFSFRGDVERYVKGSATENKFVISIHPVEVVPYPHEFDAEFYYKGQEFDPWNLDNMLLNWDGSKEYRPRERVKHIGHIWEAPTSGIHNKDFEPGRLGWILIE